MHVNSRISAWLGCLALACLLAVAMPRAAQADFKNAVVDYDQGKFDRALHEFMKMAEAGHPGAEFMLGAMYFYGKGVPPDHAIAAIWFHKAAIKGNASAQLAFGSLHIRGLGVQQDLVEAYTWLTIAGDHNIPGLQQQAITLRDEAARLMQPGEIAEAQRAAHDFSPTRAGLTLSN